MQPNAANDWSDKRIGRFFKHVAIDGDECWPFDILVPGTGYGNFSITENYNRRHYKAHRYAWVIFSGPIQEGMCVLHRCDNRACVRPDHLFLGTYKDNYADAKEKGRNTQGEKVGISKLKPIDIIEIRRRYDYRRGTAVRMAKEFGISRHTIHNIIDKRTWKHIQAEGPQ